MKHKELWGLDNGQQTPLVVFTPYERMIVDTRVALSDSSKSHLVVQHGLPGIQEDMVYSPSAVRKIQQRNDELIEAIRLEIKHIAKL